MTFDEARAEHCCHTGHSDEANRQRYELEAKPVAQHFWDAATKEADKPTLFGRNPQPLGASTNNAKEP